MKGQQWWLSFCFLKKFQVLYFVFLNPPPPFFEKNVCTELPCSPHAFCFLTQKKEDLWLVVSTLRTPGTRNSPKLQSSSFSSGSPKRFFGHATNATVTAAGQAMLQCHRQAYHRSFMLQGCLHIWLGMRLVFLGGGFNHLTRFFLEILGVIWCNFLICHYYIYIYWCFLKWWYPQNTPKWSFLVGNHP